MSKTEDLSILDKFGITISDIRNYYLIGIDPGAGDWSSAKANIVSGSFEGIGSLLVNSGGTQCKDSSVLYHEGEHWTIGDTAAHTARNAKRGIGSFFENFKVPPTSPYAKECYGNDFDNPTYLELMKQNFQCIVNRLFEQADNGLTDGKKIVFFVGRPSSDVWADAEIPYRDILMDGLVVPGIDISDVQMAVVSEAQAALAAEVYEQCLDTNQLTVVVDLGSSTLDVIVVKNGERKQGEFSRQIGAGLIEANMLELALFDDCDPAESIDMMKEFFEDDNDYKKILAYRRELRRELKSKSFISAEACEEFKFSLIQKFYQKLTEESALLRYGLRELKEKYFGEHGNDAFDCNCRTVKFEGGKKTTLDIDESLMHKAIYEMPIFVPCTDSKDNMNPYKKAYIYRSYYDAVAHFFDGVKDRLLEGEDSPTQVIITGGAAVMPFIKELVEEKFGTVPSNSKYPSYTVSKGLAYIGYAEVKKREELEVINALIDKKLKLNFVSLQYKIKSSFVNWFFERFMEDFKIWAGSAGNGVTFNSGVMGDEAYTSDDIGELALLKKWWSEDVKAKIVSEINSRFNKLYKNTAFKYDFAIAPNIVDNAYTRNRTTTVKINIEKLLGFWQMFKPNEYYPQEKRQKYLRKAKDHRSDAIEDIMGQLEICNLAKDHTTEIMDGFKRELHKDVKNYVEGLTPYIIRR